MSRTKNFAEVVRAKLAANPDLAEQVEAELFNADLASKVYAARTAAGLTQKQLAERAGTQQSVISRIEDADYEGRSLTTLNKIAKALNLRLRVEFSEPLLAKGTPISHTYSVEWPRTLQEQAPWHEFDKLVIKTLSSMTSGFSTTMEGMTVN